MKRRARYICMLVGRLRWGSVAPVPRPAKRTHCRDVFSGIATVLSSSTRMDSVTLSRRRTPAMTRSTPSPSPVQLLLVPFHRRIHQLRELHRTGRGEQLINAKKRAPHAPTDQTHDYVQAARDDQADDALQRVLDTAERHRSGPRLLKEENGALPGGGQFLQAAETVLRRTDQPLTARQITAEALRTGIFTTPGRIPADTMAARLYVDVKRNSASKFVQDVRLCTVASARGGAYAL